MLLGVLYANQEGYALLAILSLHFRDKWGIEMDTFNNETFVLLHVLRYYFFKVRRHLLALHIITRYVFGSQVHLVVP